MKLKDIMTTDVKLVPPECKVLEAAKKMKELDVGSIPVCDGKRLLGMVTDRDITLKVIAEGLNPSAVEVQKIMCSPIVYAFEDQDIEEAARIMEVKQIRRLMIISRDKELVGIVSLGDVAVKTGNESLAGEALEKISEPAKHKVA